VRDDVQVRFGRRVRELRLARGLSQEALALESGLDRSYVGQVERGERNVSLQNMVKLAQALGVHLTELLRGV
jgi:transcriptional regulator with XRE-family HTH domain